MPDAQSLKAVFSSNLRRYMERDHRTIARLAEDLGLPFSTVSDWVHGKKYPRMDKVQALADYFNILKSNLTEEMNVPLTDSERASEIESILEAVHNLPLEDIVYLRKKAEAMAHAETERR